MSVRYRIVPVVGDGTFGEVSELRFGAGVGLKAGCRRRAPHHVLELPRFCGLLTA